MKKAFTLIEVIIALTIFIVAVSVPLAIISRQFSGSGGLSRDSLSAQFIVQEDIEIVRKERDDNILSGRSWDYGIMATPKETLPSPNERYSIKRTIEPGIGYFTITTTVTWDGGAGENEESLSEDIYEWIKTE